MSEQRGEPTWSLLLEAARNLTQRGITQFTLDDLIRQVRRVDPNRERGSIAPIVQGMTANAPGGPKPACGEVLYRVDRGLYRLLDDTDRSPLPKAGHYDSLTDDDEVSLSDVDPVEFLKTALGRRKAMDELDEILDARDEVLARYGKMFHPDNLDMLSAEEFRSFLLYENNRHWMGIHRHQTAITADMDLLRDTLGLLLDENQPIEQRLDQIVRPDRANLVRGLGKAVFTPILLVVYPDRYGVWNSIAESSMKKLRLWPRFDRGATFGQKYRKVNEVMNDTAAKVGADLWTLDGLWWAAEQMPELRTETDHRPGPRSQAAPLEAVASPDEQHFALERHLHDFLADNWDLTELGAEWELLTEGGDLVGYEYPTEIGRIDLLARHRTEPRWLVVELKRDQSSDRTVGQVTRYMGWVRTHLAQEGEAVEGLVVSRTGNTQLRYALMSVPDVTFQTYTVEFTLTNPD